MRHSCLRSVIFCVGLAGCVSGSDDQRHGPVFDPTDSGTDRGATLPPEAGAPSVDAGAADTATAPDATTDAKAPEAGDAAGCTSQIALVAGSAASLDESIFAAGGPWMTSSVGADVRSAPALVAVGGGFHAVVRTAGDQLQYITSSGTTWSSPAGVGVNTTTVDKPALAVVGASVHVVYLGSNTKFYHGTFTANVWDMASDPVGGAGPLQSFGNSPPVAASIGGSLVVAQSGTDHVVYDQTLGGVVWMAAHGQVTARVGTLRPSITPLAGGANDAMIVFVHETDGKIWFLTRTTGGAWADAAAVDAAATANDPVSVAPLSGGRTVLVFRAADLKSYFSLYDAAKTPQWTPPALLAGQATPSGNPAVATGVCGDDAVAAYPLSGDNVQVVRLRGATWSAPEAVPSTNGMTSVAIATAP